MIALVFQDADIIFVRTGNRTRHPITENVPAFGPVSVNAFVTFDPYHADKIASPIVVVRMYFPTKVRLICDAGILPVPSRDEYPLATHLLAAFSGAYPILLCFPARSVLT